MNWKTSEIRSPVGSGTQVQSHIRSDHLTMKIFWIWTVISVSAISFKYTSAFPSQKPHVNFTTVNNDNQEKVEPNQNHKSKGIRKAYSSSWLNQFDVLLKRNVRRARSILDLPGNDSESTNNPCPAGQFCLGHTLCLPQKGSTTSESVSSTLRPSRGRRPSGR